MIVYNVHVVVLRGREIAATAQIVTPKHQLIFRPMFDFVIAILLSTIYL